MNSDTLTRRSGYGILAVEDSPTQAEELKYILEQRGHAVTLARDGKHALSCLADFRPALVISDIQMPEMNGYELCQHLKANEHTRSIPVLLLTSLSEVDDVFQALACGADSFVIKPYHGERLLDHVHALLSDTARHPTGLAVEVEIALAGKRQVITADPQQMIKVLSWLFEAALQRNLELARAQQALEAINDHLEDLVAERTAVLSDEITRREALQSALRALSLRDELTGLNNRRGFMTLADQYRRVAARARQDFALLYIDVNDFKHINDTFGHAAGDQALQALARLMQQVFRDADILARFGGDEFAVLLTDCPPARAQQAADRLHACLRQVNAASSGHYALSVSLGIAQYDPNAQSSLSALLEQGDADMYVNKRRLAQRGDR